MWAVRRLPGEACLERVVWRGLPGEACLERLAWGCFVDASSTSGRCSAACPLHAPSGGGVAAHRSPARRAYHMTQDHRSPRVVRLEGMSERTEWSGVWSQWRTAWQSRSTATIHRDDPGDDPGDGPSQPAGMAPTVDLPCCCGMATKGTEVRHVPPLGMDIALVPKVCA